ncbi:flagellar export protein FliJ [Marinobacter caseinilyticus]|uniref:flagellar export protein FliJ n=1 Tax=Marinobacter caseinilyticus TaxID=2692195 RepID=UPI00140D56DF|nr:flagellar export protein FliJ [Marinobacter caseinilyticus]
MLRSKRLEVVLALEQRRENEALDVMAQARQYAQQQQQRLEELHRYQADYRDQMRKSQQGVVSVSRLQGWQAFIAQLDQVIQQQERQVSHALEVLDKRRQDWQQAYERRRGMARHIDACRQQERRDWDIREQKQLDEASGRAHARRRLT